MRLLLLVLSVLFTIPLTGQSITTDRPDQTESAVTVGKGTLQLEGGMLLFRDREAAYRAITAPSVLVRYGISEILELRFFSEYSAFNAGNNRFRPQDSWSDPQLGAKLDLAPLVKTKFNMAILTHFVLPTNTSGSGASWGLVSKLALAHELSPTLSLGYNLGYNYMDDMAFPNWSAAFAFGLTDELGLFIEPYGGWYDWKEIETSLDFGFTYLLNEDVQADLSYGVGLNHETHFFSMGISWRFRDLGL
jgi:hypothetical protein